MSDPLEDNPPVLGEIKATVSDEFQQRIADQYARNIEKYAPMESYVLKVNGHDKKFNRREILGGERKQLEILRQKLRAQIAKNSPEYPNTEDQIYKKSANYQLVDPETGNGMSPEQFDMSPFEPLKQILDAITFRTDKPIPPLGTT